MIYWKIHKFFTFELNIILNLIKQSRIENLTKKEKIFLIGAGSLQFGLGSVGSIINSDILQGSTVSLHDINQANLDLVVSNQSILFRSPL